eukprot:1226567-Prymnesium_polylepis.2
MDVARELYSDTHGLPQRHEQDDESSPELAGFPRANPEEPLEEPAGLYAARGALASDWSSST